MITAVQTGDELGAPPSNEGVFALQPQTDGPAVPLHITQTSIPGTEDEVTRAAAALGLTIPAACMAEVLANLALLNAHVVRFSGAHSYGDAKAPL